MSYPLGFGVADSPLSTREFTAKVCAVRGLSGEITFLHLNRVRKCLDWKKDLQVDSSDEHRERIVLGRRLGIATDVGDEIVGHIVAVTILAVLTHFETPPFVGTGLRIRR